jgi:hypothetical protein
MQLVGPSGGDGEVSRDQIVNHRHHAAPCCEWMTRMPGPYSSIDASTMESNETMEIQRLRISRRKIGR